MLRIFRNKWGTIDNRYISYWFNGFKLIVWKGLCQDAFIELCCNISKKESSLCRRLKSSELAQVYRFEFRNKIYYHKAFLQRSRWEPIKNVFKGTRAERSFKGHLLLEKNGFGTPKVVVVGKKGTSNFMITEAMADERGGRAYWQESLPVAEARGKTFITKRNLIQSLGCTIGKLHAAGIFHGDLRLNNMGIDSKKPGKWQFEFIDNERTRKFKRLPDTRRIKNLVQLCMSVTPPDQPHRSAVVF